jgi:hypothetical protein
MELTQGLSAQLLIVVFLSLCASLWGAVSVIALSYYKAERALVDCSQEYREREMERKRRLRKQQEAADAAADAAAAGNKQ